jgi:uncharacterized protein
MWSAAMLPGIFRLSFRFQGGFVRKVVRSLLFVLACWGVVTPSILRAQAPVTPAPDLEAIAKQNVAEMAAGQFDAVEAQYSTQMAFALPKGKLADAWNGVIAQVGAFKGIGESHLRLAQGLQVVTLSCNFEKTALDVIFSFDAGGKLASLHIIRPESTAVWALPAYANAAAFLEQSVTVSFSHWQLPGTLTMPQGAGPFPAVVLVQGAGPQDQDETLGPNKPFKDLAMGLASQGIAVLRYVKRTKQYAAGAADDPTKMTVDDETINDARAAVTLLANQQRIDPHHIYVLGYSFGGYLAPRIAAGNTQVAGLILLAGNSRPVEQMAVERVRYLVGVQQMPLDQAQKTIEAVEAEVKDIDRPDLKPSDTVEFLGSPQYGAYWLDLRGYDPVAVASHSTIPMLILQGERDYQVTMVDFDGWKKGLAGHANVTLKSYPALNHLFIAGTGPPTATEYGSPGHVSADVISDIDAWIVAASKAN